MKKLYIIPSADRLAQSVQLAEQWDAGFEYNDFYSPRVLDNVAKVDRLIALYQSLDRDRSDDVLHGAFLDVTVHSTDPMIRAVADRRVRQSMEIARRLGIRGVVFHTNHIPNFKSDFYVSGFLSENERYWRAIAAEYPQLQIYMENMFDTEPDLLAVLAQRLADVKNFGVCFDFAHANVFGDGSAHWIRALSPHILHVHLNDNDKKTDLHGAVGSGSLDFDSFDREIRAVPATPGVLVEMHDLQDQQQSLEYMKQHGIYPFEKGDWHA